MLIQPKIRGFVCITAHPTGCAAHVQEQINLVKSRGTIANAPKRVLVIGASTGYGLASRIAAAFGGGAKTIGVAFERAPEADKCASAGWYNTAAFELAAKKENLYARTFNGDAFSDTMKTEVLAAIKADLGQIDCLIYSLASPRRTNPRTGETFKSVLKPIGQDFTAKTLDTDRKQVTTVTLTPASDEEIRQTVGVMGGEDWQMWMEELLNANLLAPGFQTLNYSYIGPEVTWPIYKDGTIGRAKADMEICCRTINEILEIDAPELKGKARVAILKAVVSQASSAIPVVPLYISLLFKIMKTADTHEDTIQQIDRMYRELCGNKLRLDNAGRIRIDNLEMEPSIQSQVKNLWPTVTTENLDLLTDFKGYQTDFLKLFGFGLTGVDYTKESDPMLWIPSLPQTPAKV